MYKQLFIAFILFLPLMILSQNPEGDKFLYSGNDSTQYSDSDFNAKEIAAFLKERKLKFRVEVGTSFGTSFGSGNYFGTYLAPHLSYSISPRFNINAGAIINNSFGKYSYNPLYSDVFTTNGSAFTRAFIYFEGAYRLNEKLTLTGAVYKEINLLNVPDPATREFNLDRKGFIFGIDYKLGENVFIRGQINVSNGVNPYYPQPYLGPSNNFPLSPSLQPPSLNTMDYPF